MSNESSEIIRMLNGVFDHLTGNTDDWPKALRDAIGPDMDLSAPHGRG